MAKQKTVSDKICIRGAYYKFSTAEECEKIWTEQSDYIKDILAKYQNNLKLNYETVKSLPKIKKFLIDTDTDYYIVSMLILSRFIYCHFDSSKNLFHFSQYKTDWKLKDWKKMSNALIKSKWNFDIVSIEFFLKFLKYKIENEFIRSLVLTKTTTNGEISDLGKAMIEEFQKFVDKRKANKPKDSGQSDNVDLTSCQF